MRSKPITTLFMLSSLDGKISTGDKDTMDVDTDYSKISGIKEGLYQYYDLEKKTDLYFLISGRVMTKGSGSLDINNRKDEPKKIGANCIIVDNNHLKESGISYLLKKFKSLTIVTSNKSHIAIKMKSANLNCIKYNNQVNFPDLFKKLKNNGVRRLTIQSGGTLNATLLRNNLIDKVSIVVAPCLIGGKDTSSLIDGESLHTQKELKHIKALKLKEYTVMKNSFIHLVYEVKNATKIN